MHYTTLGQTGLKVSKVGLGGATYVYGSANERQAVVDVIKHAYSKGINVFDTAPLYKSEDIFGDGLRGIDRSSYVLITKFGRYPEAEPLKRFDYSARRTEESVRESLRLLQTDYVDILKIHDMEYAGEGVVDLLVSETLPVLDKLRQEGVVKHIGIGSYDLAKTKQIVEKSRVKIESVLNHSCLTLIDNELADYVEFFKSRGIGIINASPLSHGLLTTKELPPWVTASEALRSASQKAVQMCKDGGFSIEKLAIGYFVKESERLGIETVLTGAGSIARLDSNLAIIEGGLTDAEWAMCQRLKTEVFSKLPQADRNWVWRDAKEFADQYGATICANH